MIKCAYWFYQHVEKWCLVTFKFLWSCCPNLHPVFFILLNLMKLYLQKCGQSAQFLTWLCFIERVRILSSWLRSNNKLRPTSSWWGFILSYTKKLEEKIFEFRPAVAVSWMFMSVKAHVAFLGGSTWWRRWTPSSLIGLRELFSSWHFSAEGFSRETAKTETVYRCSKFYTHFFFLIMFTMWNMSIFWLLFLFFSFFIIWHQ